MGHAMELSPADLIHVDEVVEVCLDDTDGVAKRAFEDAYDDLLFDFHICEEEGSDADRDVVARAVWSAISDLMEKDHD